MGWKEVTVVDARRSLVEAVLAKRLTMTEACAVNGVSRKTGYKWFNRHSDAGVEGLVDRSRAPHTCPLKTPVETEELVVALRDRFPHWGARKIRARLMGERPELQVPSRSTTHDILVRHGLVVPRRKRRRRQRAPRPNFAQTAPNDVWCADFKGQFRTRDGVYCFPLTVTDHASRNLLACDGKLSVAIEGARQSFETLFVANGLPLAILTDNGVPFAHPTAICQLSSLAAWWVRLGIQVIRIQPGRPDQNGRHERMHRTLKAETTRPPADDLASQQVRFDEFRRYFNEERPHEALDDDVPANRWWPSPRLMPSSIEPPSYPGHFELRKVNGSGKFNFRTKIISLSSNLAGETIGLEEVDDGQWDVHYRNTILGHLISETGRLTEVGPSPLFLAQPSMNERLSPNSPP